MPGTTHFSIEGNFINVVSNGGYLDGGMDQRSFDPSAATPPEKNQESNPHRDSGSVWQSHPENMVTGRAKH